MQWRCEWCGKPHEENDPPCDNCGHGTFEEAVVRRTDLSEGGGPESTTVWVCTECGRNHTKHAPPCSRCGNNKLVRKQQRVDDDELSVPSYLDLVTPTYVVGLLAVVALAALFVLGLAGIVPLPGFDSGVPEVSNVPGNATMANGYELGAVETAYFDQLTEEQTLTRIDRLDEVATFYTQRRVKADYGDGTLPSNDRLKELIGGECNGDILEVPLRTDGSEYDTPQALADAFTVQYVAAGSTDRDFGRKTGIGTHTAPDGTVYLTQFVC